MRIEQSAAVSAASSGEPAQQAFGLVDGDTRIAVPRWRLSAGYESRIVPVILNHPAGMRAVVRSLSNSRPVAL
jgi:hypothetical protein